MTSLKGALGWLLAVFACLFGLTMSLFLIGVGIVAWVSDSNILAFGMRIILIAGIVGLAAVLLAGSRLRWIFPLWCLFVLVMLIRGFFLSSYSFGGPAGFQLALGLTIGALIAFLGSLGMLRRRSARR
jgi:hypothetical protein